MATVTGKSAYREYILKDGSQTLDSVSLTAQIEVLREVLERMRGSSQTAALVMDRKPRNMAPINRL